MSDLVVVNVRMDGLKLESLNKPFLGASRSAVFARARTIRELRQAVRSHVLPHVATGELRTIEIARVAPRRLDDDNLIGACKPVLDGIADAWEVNDRTFVIVGDRDGVPVTVRQVSEAPKRYALVVTLGLEDRHL